jgi:hypothetical protein
MVAATIFVGVVLITLQQVKESADTTRAVTAQADLRKIGESIIDEITRDLRSTQARWVGANSTTLQFQRVTKTAPKFDTATGDPILDGGSNPVIYEYSQTNTATGDLSFRFGPSSPAWTASSPGTQTRSSELAVAGDTLLTTSAAITQGFTVSAIAPTTSLPGLLTATPSVFFTDQPTLLQIQLILKRRLGKFLPGQPGYVTGGANNWNAFVVMQTQIQLKPSGSY